MAEMRASPVKSKTLKRLADIVRMAEDQGQMEFLPFNPMTLFPVSSTTLENLAYGNLPMAIPSQSNIPITKTGRKQEVAELAGLGLMAPGAGRTTKVVADAAGDAMVQFLTRNPRATAMGVLDEAGQMAPLANIAKLKGIPINEILFPGKSVKELSSVEKSALTRFEKELAGSQAVRRREEFRLGGQDITKPTPGLNLVSEIAFNPERMLHKRAVPVFGDLSGIGEDVYQVGGVPLSSPVTKQGGRKYALVDKNIQAGIPYASELNAAANKTANFAKYDEPTVGVFFGGGPESLDFSHHMAQSFIRQLDALQPSKDAIKQFNEAVRNKPVQKAVPGSTKKVTTYPFKNFSGIDSPNIEDLLTVKGSTDFTPGQLRTAISQVTNSAAMRKLGFPIYEDTRKVMTESGLRPGYAGQLIFEAQPERGLLQPEYIHQSYSTGIPGKYLGGININAPQTGVPAELIFPKLFAEQRALGKRDDQILAKMRQSHQGEVFDQEALDALMLFLGQQPGK